jgi:hypothetical protein
VKQGKPSASDISLIVDSLEQLMGWWSRVGVKATHDVISGPAPET